MSRTTGTSSKSIESQKASKIVPSATGMALGGESERASHHAHRLSKPHTTSHLHWNEYELAWTLTTPMVHPAAALAQKVAGNLQCVNLV